MVSSWQGWRVRCLFQGRWQWSLLYGEERRRGCCREVWWWWWGWGRWLGDCVVAIGKNGCGKQIIRGTRCVLFWGKGKPVRSRVLFSLFKKCLIQFGRYLHSRFVTLNLVLVGRCRIDTFRMGLLFEMLAMCIMYNWNCVFILLLYECSAFLTI